MSRRPVVVGVVGFVVGLGITLLLLRLLSDDGADEPRDQASGTTTSATKQDPTPSTTTDLPSSPPAGPPTFEAIAGLAHTQWLQTVVLSPDGSLVAGISGTDSEVHVWDTATGKKVNAFAASQAVVTLVGFSPDGQMLATAAGGAGVNVDQSVRFWDTDRYREVAYFPEDRGGSPTTRVVFDFSPDGKLLAAANLYGLLSLWDTSQKTRLDYVPKTGAEDPQNSIIAVAFSGDGALLATGNTYGGRVRLWDATTRAEVGQVDLDPVQQFMDLDLTFDGSLLVTRTYTNSTGEPNFAVQVWDTETGQEVATLLHSDLPARFAISPDGSRIASTGGDGAVLLWDTKKRTAIDPLAGAPGCIGAVDFSRDGSRFACATKAGVGLWTTD